MSLDRKDVRLKLDPDVHAGLVLLADVDNEDLGIWAERILVAEIRRRIHVATVLADKARRLGIAGNGGESGGKIRE